ncbi:hypothetical protein QQF64_026640 [Cirrhinus molitorella]|uniref:Uncharacterized protein n=1 Tax=Cirrhinus molitorella TaxID=172907 RepID=A0ABR3NAH0_9TELE
MMIFRPRSRTGQGRLGRRPVCTAFVSHRSASSLYRYPSGGSISSSAVCVAYWSCASHPLSTFVSLTELHLNRGAGFKLLRRRGTALKKWIWTGLIHPPSLELLQRE